MCNQYCQTSTLTFTLPTTNCKVTNIPCKDVNPKPCSKRCDCYLSQMVADLKTSIATRCKALAQVSAEPEWIVNLTESERRLLPLDGSLRNHDNDPSSSSTTIPTPLVSCILAHELDSRERDLGFVTEQQTRLTNEVDQFARRNDTLRKLLTEAKASVKKTKLMMMVQREKGEERDTERGKKLQRLLERSEERRCRMAEIFDACIPCCPKEVVACASSPAKDRKLDRAALKSALRALARLNAERCDDGASTASIVLKFGPGDDCLDSSVYDEEDDEEDYCRCSQETKECETSDRCC